MMKHELISLVVTMKTLDKEICQYQMIDTDYKHRLVEARDFILSKIQDTVKDIGE